MTVTLPLEKMTIEEKIHTMETIWEDLCKSVDGVPSPAWHGRILKERERMDKSGDDEFVDWEQAKKNIRNDIS